jgi:TPR repeat protein
MKKLTILLFSILISFSSQADEEEILEQIRNCKWNSDIAAYKKENPSKAWKAAVLSGGLKKCKPGDEYILRKWGINPDASNPTQTDFQDGVDAYNRGDYKTAFNEWQPLAEQGYAGAQNNLALLYENGTGVLKDYKEAVKWYRKAAEQNYVEAQYSLALMYGKGLGVPYDLSKAKHWIKKAYENPQASASIRKRAKAVRSALEEM